MRGSVIVNIKHEHRRKRRKEGSMVDLLRFSPRVTRSLRSLPCTQALFETLDSSRDVTIMGNFKNTKSQGKT